MNKTKFKKKEIDIINLLRSKGYSWNEIAHVMEQNKN